MESLLKGNISPENGRMTESQRGRDRDIYTGRQRYKNPGQRKQLLQGLGEAGLLVLGVEGGTAINIQGASRIPESLEPAPPPTGDMHLTPDWVSAKCSYSVLGRLLSWICWWIDASLTWKLRSVRSSCKIGVLATVAAAQRVTMCKAVAVGAVSAGGGASATAGWV